METKLNFDTDVVIKEKRILFSQLNRIRVAVQDFKHNIEVYPQTQFVETFMTYRI